MELLVVIAIVAILSSIGFAVYSSVQQKARDSKRRSDVDALVKALEVNKVLGAAAYSQFQAVWFAGGKIPVEVSGYTPQYTLVYPAVIGVTSIALVSNPTWAANITNIATGQFTTIPLNSTLSIQTVGVGVPSSPATFTAFQVCARLETGVVFCKPSAQ